jgi:hypothetical protein
MWTKFYSCKKWVLQPRSICHPHLSFILLRSSSPIAQSSLVFHTILPRIIDFLYSMPSLWAIIRPLGAWTTSPRCRMRSLRVWPPSSRGCRQLPWSILWTSVDHMSSICMIFSLPSDVSQVQCLIPLYPRICCPLFFNLFRCTVFRNPTVTRKEGEGMMVQREWDLRMSSCFMFITLIRVCAKCGNNHASFVLGLVKSQPLSIIFPNYPALLSMYLMLNIL